MISSLSVSNVFSLLPKMLMHFLFVCLNSVVTMKLVSHCEPHILIHEEKLRVLGGKKIYMSIFEHNFCPSSIVPSPG